MLVSFFPGGNSDEDPAHLDAELTLRDGLPDRTSMLLYAVLHLSGYGVSLDDLKVFRARVSVNRFGLVSRRATHGPLMFHS